MGCPVILSMTRAFSFTYCVPELVEKPPTDNSTLVGIRILNGREFELPPPGNELKTLMFIIPGSAMSSAEIDACICVLETNIVGRFKPFHLTTDPCMKFVPVTVSEKPAPPARAEDGLRLVTLGTGLIIENGNEFERPPPGIGLNTVTLAVPPPDMSSAVMVALT
jgi:hypothetical protein